MRSNWILTDVIPFLRIASCTSQNVIERAALPDWVTGIIALYGFADNAFERADPTPKSYLRWNRHEKMQVVWQNYVSANCNSEIILPSLSKLKEGGVNSMICKQSPTSIRTARDEVQRVMRVNPFQSSRRTGKLRHSREYYSDFVASKSVDVDPWATRRLREWLTRAAFRTSETSTAVSFG